MMSSFRGYFEANFWLRLGRLLCHVYGRFVVAIGAGLSLVERVVSEMSLGKKKIHHGSSKCASGTQFHRLYAVA